MDGSRDPFLEQFYNRVPAAVAATFTDAQLDAVKRAYGARTRGAHGIELRKSFPFLWMRLYIVLLMGREKRDPERLSREGGLLGRLGDTFFTGFTWMLFLLPWLGAFYLVKSVAGINLLHEGGVHTLWNDLLRQIELMFS